MPWHVLDVGSVWVKEFAGSLERLVPTVNWLPDIDTFGSLKFAVRNEIYREPNLALKVFSLQRGYSRFPISLLARLGPRQSKRMLALSDDVTGSPLICTTPFYAPVAQRWRGPVIYYQTDLTLAYAGIKPEQVRSLDRRLCRAATVVCPNSERIAEYMTTSAGCDPAKIVIVPNATRASNICADAPQGTGPLPPDLGDLPRPIIGVIGNLAGNLNWTFLRSAIELTPSCSWVLVGPTDMQISEELQNSARDAVQAMGGRVRFVGAKEYGELQSYARAVDAAVLPYRRKEPTYSGSSTRFYEHLAACRPMIATRGFAELLTKEPLVTLVDDAAGLAEAIQRLERLNFRDGYEQERWSASQTGTWDVRAATVVNALSQRSTVQVPLPETLQHKVESAGLSWRDGSRSPNREFSLVTPD